MIKKLLSISLFTASLAANAQQITNAGFETWTTITPITPTSWGTIDKAIANSALAPVIGSTSFVTQSTSPHSGTYAATVTTKSVSIGGNPATFPGVLVYGNMTLNGTTPSFTGQAYTSNPATVTYYVKGTVIAGDSAPTIVLLTKWNTATSKRDTIGLGSDFVNSSVSSATYTARTFPIFYSGGAPDTMIYIITSSVKSSGTATLGTSITVDDISFAGNEAGIASHTAQNTVVAYPNPAISQITIAVSNEKAKQATVYDLTGRVVGKYEMLNKQTIIDLNAFQNGMYIYMITDESNHTLVTSKFSVSK